MVKLKTASFFLDYFFAGFEFPSVCVPVSLSLFFWRTATQCVRKQLGPKIRDFRFGPSYTQMTGKALYFHNILTAAIFSSKILEIFKVKVR